MTKNIRSNCSDAIDVRREQVIWECLKELDNLENATAPKLTFSSTTIDICMDNDTMCPLEYNAPARTHSVVLRNDGELPTIFRFNRSEHHKPLSDGTHCCRLCVDTLSLVKYVL